MSVAVSCRAWPGLAWVVCRHDPVQPSLISVLYFTVQICTAEGLIVHKGPHTLSAAFYPPALSHSFLFLPFRLFSLLPSFSHHTALTTRSYPHPLSHPQPPKSVKSTLSPNPTRLLLSSARFLAICIFIFLHTFFFDNLPHSIQSISFASFSDNSPFNSLVFNISLLLHTSTTYTTPLFTTTSILSHFHRLFFLPLLPPRLLCVGILLNRPVWSRKEHNEQ